MRIENEYGKRKTKNKYLNRKTKNKKRKTKTRLENEKWRTKNLKGEWWTRTKNEIQKSKKGRSKNGNLKRKEKQHKKMKNEIEKAILNEVRMSRCFGTRKSNKNNRHRTDNLTKNNKMVTTFDWGLKVLNWYKFRMLSVFEVSNF